MSEIEIGYSFIQRFTKPLAIVILFYSTEKERFQLVFSTTEDVQYISSKELNKVNIQQVRKPGLHTMFLGLSEQNTS